MVMIVGGTVQAFLAMFLKSLQKRFSIWKSSDFQIENSHQILCKFLYILTFGGILNLDSVITLSKLRIAELIAFTR